MLLVITTRKGLPDGMSTLASLRNALTRLNGEESLSLLSSLDAETGLSAADCMVVRDRAEGVPLYLEEFARAQPRIKKDKQRADAGGPAPHGRRAQLIAVIPHSAPR